MASKFSGDVNVTALVAQVHFKCWHAGSPFRLLSGNFEGVQDLQPNERQLIDNVIVVYKLNRVNPATSATGGVGGGGEGYSQQPDVES